MSELQLQVESNTCNSIMNSVDMSTLAFLTVSSAISLLGADKRPSSSLMK
jgi:hypothetical protein